MEAVQEIAKFLTTFCCALFTGASVYVSLVEHPARMECGGEVAVTEFGPSYRRAARIQPSLAAVGLLSSIVAWLGGANIGWLVGGVLLGSVIPFTIWIIMPINKQLFASTLNKRSVQAEELMSRWGKLHSIRSLLSVLALVILLLSA